MKRECSAKNEIVNKLNDAALIRIYKVKACGERYLSYVRNIKRYGD